MKMKIVMAKKAEANQSASIGRYSSAALQYRWLANNEAGGVSYCNIGMAINESVAKVMRLMARRNTANGGGSMWLWRDCETQYDISAYVASSSLSGLMALA
jgi:hypothetical protein